MRNANSQNERPELNEALKAWQPPDLPPALDQRILASYRQQMNRVPFWRRFFTTSIPVPLPLVIVQALLLLVASGAVIAFFQERDRQPAPLAQQQRQIDPVAVPLRQEIPAATAVADKPVKKRLRQRQPRPRISLVTLPVSTIPSPIIETAKESSVGTIPAEIQMLSVTAESLSLTTPTAPELRLQITPSLPLKTRLPEPLRFDFSAFTTTEAALDLPTEKEGFFDGRISRTISRAGNWVTKPLEKGMGLYRALPRTIPTLNSFIAPAKDACLAPFRSAPVNVQIN